jgi:hypothetical protein
LILRGRFHLARGRFYLWLGRRLLRLGSSIENHANRRRPGLPDAARFALTLAAVYALIAWLDLPFWSRREMLASRFVAWYACMAVALYGIELAVRLCLPRLAHNRRRPRP